MRKFSLTLTLIFAAFWTVGEKPDHVICNENDGWTCTVWGQDQNCLGCSKISTVVIPEKTQSQKYPLG
ncbi:MAG: hypothetical protein BGO67_01745 [Alphaproteobacteria bacterium 41-28]|nr:MAG: hypothetical protein BGO67_01745 [Alphaproteobacteria bacterium 41-28]